MSFPAHGPRYEETFPTLTSREIERLRHFGSLRRYAGGEKLFRTGEPGPGMFLILSGVVAISQHDGLGHVAPIAEQGPGQFVAEIGQLSNRPALVDGTAEGDVEALLIPPGGVRALLVAEADLGERIMRALILRRVTLIESGAGGPVLIGAAASWDIARLQNFLSRNAYPYHLLDPETDHEARDLIAHSASFAGTLPLVVCANGVVLSNPSETELAKQLGMIGTPRPDFVYDVAVVGAGPAGLSTAVYATSEGLSVVVLDSRAFGGQAGASARIENYFGFPTGISGQALTARAFIQAQKFGAEMMIPTGVRTLDCSRSNGALTLELEGGERVQARAVVVASGARYRRPAVAGLADFEGRGVWYWASLIEARLCAGDEVVLVGGGNSAGQAAVFLASHASKVRMLVRGPGLADSMSSYLIERIAAAPNIELMNQTEIVALSGTPHAGLEKVRWRHRGTGAEAEAAIRHVFLFIGADPATEWLQNCGVTVDKTGFVITGARLGEGESRSSSPLESSISGVFAVGDVRSGSTKRVGSAIGEGAQVVAAIHEFLAQSRGATPSAGGEPSCRIAAPI